MHSEVTMKNSNTSRKLLAALLTGLVLVGAQVAHAYPPAPDHQIYGLIRNEFGDPLMESGAQVIFTTTSGVQITTTVVPGLEAGVNYRLKIPMDAGILPGAYKPTALSANIPFTIKVKIGSVDYVPMELVGSITRVGSPAKSTRIDMTLGVDSDGDGLPDAWEWDLLDWLGNGGGLGDINPNDDSDGDGISNMNEYLAGTYAWDAGDAFTIAVKERANGGDVIEFLAITGRSYLLSRSSDLKTWTPVEFSVPAESDSIRSFYPARDVRTLRVNIPVGTNAPTIYTYRGIVQ